MVCREDKREINRGKGQKKQKEKEAALSIRKYSQIMLVFKVAFRDKVLSPLKWKMYIHLDPSLSIFERGKDQIVL